MQAYLILEDGQVFQGETLVDFPEVISELVFNTSMTGYLEVLTDPSYAGQSVLMTYPLIGNYGVCLDDQEADHPYVRGFVVNELARKGSHFRKEIELKDYLIERHIPCIQGIDTRYLTKIIRNRGCMNCLLTTKKYDDLSTILPKIKSYQIQDTVALTTCKQPYTLGQGKKKVALYDFGTKKNIVRSLVNRGLQVTVYPAFTPAKTILAGNYDGIFLSNGPGDPSDNLAIIAEMQILAKSGLPIFAICLGHQIMALAHGFKTEKLKYGHHGANHPVKNLDTGNVYISTQNHNYVVKDESIDRTIAKPWFINVNDGTIEGIEYLKEKIKTVQFHPEACAGPLDTEELFNEFIKMIGDE